MNKEAGLAKGPQPIYAATTELEDYKKPTLAQIEVAHRLGVVLKPGDTKVSVYRRIGHVLGLINADLESRAMRWAGQRARA